MEWTSDSVKMVYVRDQSGWDVLKYALLIEYGKPVFYGGNVDSSRPAFDHGPHVMHTASSLLQLLGRLSNFEEGGPYVLSSSFGTRVVQLGPVMHADDIANVLGIDVEDVVKEYSLLVKLEKRSE